MKTIGYNFLERHAKMEYILNVDLEHVIVDFDDWEKVVSYFRNNPKEMFELTKENIPYLTSEEFKEGKAGYILAPYIIAPPTSTTVNGTTVWHRNKLKNLLLKIKFLFVKRPDWCSKTIANKYSERTVNNKYYSKINIEKDDNQSTNK